MRTILAYTAARLGIFAGCLLVLWLVFGRMTSIWLIALLSLLFTSGLSMLLLRKQGSAAGKAMTDRVTAIRQKYENARSKEDVD